VCADSTTPPAGLDDHTAYCTGTFEDTVEVCYNPDRCPNNPNLDAPGKCGCNEPFYKRSSSIVTHEEALQETPYNCQLVTIESQADIDAALNAIDELWTSGTAQVWTALYKPDSVVPTSPGGATTSGWLNFPDDAPLPDSAPLWRNPEPNNQCGSSGVGRQTRVTLVKDDSNDGLRDVNPTTYGSCLAEDFKALYICCYPGLCPC
jgi:hypothetical protein